MTKIEEIFEELKKGKIPKDLESKTELASNVMFTERLGFAVSGLMLASARRDNFKDNKADWVKWANENFNCWDIPERSKRNKFGMILLAIPEANHLDYERLFKLDCHKAKEISKFVKRENIDEIKSVELKNILTFMGRNVEDMTRDEVRDAVDECLERPVKEKKSPFSIQQPELPGFKQSISDIYNSMGKTNPGDLLNSCDPNTAKMTTSVGMNCLNLISSYYKKSGEYKNLTVEELNGLETYANKLCKQFGSWREEVCANTLKTA